MTKIYINTDEMISDRNSISQRIDRIQELFDKTDKGMNLSKEKEIWLGCTSDALYLKYEELSNNYEVIIMSMKKIVEVLDKITNAYIEWDASMIKLSETYDLTVNSI
jgi:hypothetical protein